LFARSREFLQRDATFGLEPDVDDGEVLLAADDGALDDAAFDEVVGLAGFIEEGCETPAGRALDGFAPRAPGDRVRPRPAVGVDRSGKRSTTSTAPGGTVRGPTHSGVRMPVRRPRQSSGRKTKKRDDASRSRADSSRSLRVSGACRRDRRARG